jgi:hypothetical protein
MYKQPQREVYQTNKLSISNKTVKFIKKKQVKLSNQTVNYIY